VQQHVVAVADSHWREMAAAIHHQQPAAGIPGREKEGQLLIQGRGDQIQAPPHHQHGHRQGRETVIRPEEAAEGVEQHHRPQIRRRRGRARQGSIRQLALQQPRGVADRQALHGLAAAGVQAIRRSHPRRQQGCHATEGVAGQHQARALHRQAPLLLRQQHGLHIGQAAGKALRPRRPALPRQGIAHRLGVAARVLQHHHRPAAAGQGRRQPAKLLGIAPQPRHHQHPGAAASVVAALRRRPDAQRQGLGTTLHRQRQPTGLDPGLGAGDWLQGAARQRQGLQRHEGALLADQLIAPALGQAEEIIELKAQLRRWHGFEHIQQRHLRPCLQQLSQGLQQ
jgi:hypothetical protein